MKNKFDSSIIHKDEKILWKGNYFPLEENGGSSFLNRAIKFIEYLRRLFYVGVIILLIYSYLISLFSENQLLPFAIYVLAYILFYLIYFLYDRKKYNSKLYIITNQRVIFQEWYIRSGIRSKSVWLKNIDKVSLQEFDHDISTIYFMGKRLGDYKNTEFYPALVQIKKGKEVYEMLYKII